MRILQLVIMLVGGGLGLLAVPLLPQQAQDWVTASQARVAGWADQAPNAFVSDSELDAAVSPVSTPRAPRVPITGSTLAPPPTPTVVAARDSATQDLKEFMLDLINRDRMDNGLTPVERGHNLAAQAHAEELFQRGFLGHWGLDGLKPYMRYTLASGAGAEAENVAGSNMPRIHGASYAKTPVRDSLLEAEEGLMASPGHRRNILNPWHQRVNLGIACDDVGCTVVQQFEHTYVQFDRVPSVSKGRLAFAGRLLGGFTYGGA